MSNHHHHNHSHDEDSSKSWTERNREHWDKSVATYASADWQKELINKTHAFLLSHLSWLGVDFIDPSTSFEATESTRQIRVLDYACGPGTISNILIGHATEFIGVDVSQNMVNAYNERSMPNARALIGDLLHPDGPTESVSGPEFFDFDLAVVGFGFHHFENLPLATERLASRLKPGGVVMIADFIHHQAVDHGAQNTIVHNGFGEEEVRKIFSDAGLVDFGFLKLPEGVNMVFKEGKEHYRDIFLAKARKPA